MPDQVFCLHVLPWMFIKQFWRTLWLQADKFPRVHKRPSYSMPLTTPVNLKELLCPYPYLICMYAYTYKISVFIQTQTCKTARGEVWIYIRTELELVWCSLQQHSAPGSVQEQGCRVLEWLGPLLEGNSSICRSYLIHTGGWWWDTDLLPGLGNHFLPGPPKTSKSLGKWVPVFTSLSQPKRLKWWWEPL